MSLYDDLKCELSEHLFSAGDADTPTESAIYRPSASSAREIQVFIERDTAEDIGRAKSPVIRVTALNCPASGIDTRTLDIGRDQIEIAHRSGTDTKVHQLYRIIDHTATHVHLEAR